MMSHTVDFREDDAMLGAIKREDAGRINKKLLECRTHLQKDNIYSCLTRLKGGSGKVAYNSNAACRRETTT